jgi:hypothetical protein
MNENYLWKVAWIPASVSTPEMKVSWIVIDTTDVNMVKKTLGLSEGPVIIKEATYFGEAMVITTKGVEKL